MLITDEYRRLNADLHKRAVFGQRGGRHERVVRELLAEVGGRTVCDYGAGRGDLAAALSDVPVWSYDPAVERFATLPPPCDVVVCGDVLEHIEPDCLDEVLAHLASLTRLVAHIVVAIKPDGQKRLADGRDPHLIIRPPEWWREKLQTVFAGVRLVSVDKRDCTFRCSPRTT